MKIHTRAKVRVIKRTARCALPRDIRMQKARAYNKTQYPRIFLSCIFNDFLGELRDWLPCNQWIGFPLSGGRRAWFAKSLLSSLNSERIGRVEFRMSYTSGQVGVRTELRIKSRVINAVFLCTKVVASWRMPERAPSVNAKENDDDIMTSQWASNSWHPPPNILNHAVPVIVIPVYDEGSLRPHRPQQTLTIINVIADSRN